ncbi:MAG: hypothetical protein PHT97_10950 [Methanoculleus sp.]|uniref:hypothetical protein n=1 Tax=Methanoculleus sp. TaxID=90427 RepID=UPI002609AE1B|nr:hypothetical protein [Methanoculleus sp.]MDD2255258.1 hypothetical protein [Methanoculleus sp.]MDD4471659.1 hypothetical protein [Methanoculleus sp.]
MTRSKLSGGVINVVDEDHTNGAITYISVACVDGTLRRFVGQMTPSDQLDVDDATFKDYLVYEYCECRGDDELIDKHVRICKAMLGDQPDDDLLSTVLRDHLDWVNRQ